MKHHIRCTINGVEHELLVESHHTLIQVLRDQLKLFGAREACGVSVCGACTVLVNGEPVSSCIMLAPFADGKNIETIEGLANGDELHPLQEEFWHKGAIQCAYCTPGLILAAKAMFDVIPDASEEEMKEYMAGNICRCTGYVKILEAIYAAKERLFAKEKSGQTA